MAEQYRFFNSIEGDKRSYEAKEFAEYFAQFLSSGLFHQNGKPNLKVLTDGTDRKVYAEAGTAIIKGHMYKNTENLYLDIEPSHTTLDRIDRIVLRLDNRVENRYIKAFVLKGIPASVPVAPELTRTDDIYELSLASVLVKANTWTIDSGLITDERLNEDVCGVVSSQITIPTDTIQADFDKFKSQINDEFYTWFNDLVLHSDAEFFNSAIRLLQLNQLEIIMQRYLEGKDTSMMDEGYFFDTLSDTSKIDLEKTSAVINTTDRQIEMGEGNIESVVVWKPHAVGFVTDKVTHFQTRPTNTFIPLTADALGGQNKINVASVKVTITEVTT